jgi:hypothetical protein
MSSLDSLGVVTYRYSQTDRKYSLISIQNRHKLYSANGEQS